MWLVACVDNTIFHDLNTMISPKNITTRETVKIYLVHVALFFVALSSHNLDSIRECMQHHHEWHSLCGIWLLIKSYNLRIKKSIWFHEIDFMLGILHKLVLTWFPYKLNITNISRIVRWSMLNTNLPMETISFNGN